MSTGIWKKFIILLIAGLAFAQMDIDALNRELDKKGASWSAAENWITELPPEERKMLLGETGIEPDIPRSEPKGTKATLDLPASFDWRSHEGRNWMTGVKNQGSCGSCWAFGTVGQWEASINIALDSAEYDLNLSEQQLNSCDTRNSGCSGGTFAAVYLRDVGVFDESCFPYSHSDEDCDHRCVDWEDRIYYRMWSYTSTFAWGDDAIDRIKAVVIQNPTYTSMDVYSDFYGYDSGVYEHTTGGYEGGHGIVIVGWDDADSCWIAKNSWGGGWGMSGYFKIRYGDSDFGRRGYVVRVAPRVNVISPISRVYPAPGYSFLPVDSTLFIHADSPVMGMGDTIYRCTGAEVSGFRYDTTFSTDTFTITVDGPQEIIWHWDTVADIPKMNVTFESSHDSTFIEFHYMKLRTDTTVSWMADSTVTLRTDSHQTLFTAPRRQVAVSWVDWSDGGTLSHDVTLSSTGADTFRANFTEDTVRFEITISSNEYPNFLLDGEGQWLTYTDHLDSGRVYNLWVEEELPNGPELAVFDQWMPGGTEPEMDYEIYKPETLFANYDVWKQTYIWNDFGFGDVFVDGARHPSPYYVSVDSGEVISLGVIDTLTAMNVVRGHVMWSDSIAEPHEINLDALRQVKGWMVHTDQWARISITDSTGTDRDSLVPSGDTVYVPSGDSLLLGEWIEKRITGWEYERMVVDTIFYEGWDGDYGYGSATPFPPERWYPDTFDNMWAQGYNYRPLGLPAQGTGMLQFRASYTELPYTAWIRTDTFYLPEGRDSLRFHFWVLHSIGGDALDTLTIEVSTDFGISFDTLLTLDRSERDGWYPYNLDLDAYGGDSVVFRFFVTPGGWSQWPMFMDNTMFYATYTDTTSGEGDTASFIADFNGDLRFLYEDARYRVDLFSEHGSPTGGDFYDIGDYIYPEVGDSITEDGYLFLLSGWQGLDTTIAKGGGAEVARPGSLLAVWDTLFSGHVIADMGFFRIDGDSLTEWQIWTDGTDSTLVELPDSIHFEGDTLLLSTGDFYASFEEPDTINTIFDILYGLRLGHSPDHIAPWLAIEADTSTDSLFAWITEGGTADISAEAAFYDFLAGSTWTHTGFEGGAVIAGTTEPITQATRITALYEGQPMYVDFSLSPDTLWMVTDSLDCYARPHAWTSPEEMLTVENTSNCPVDFGLSIGGDSDSMWHSDTLPAFCAYRVAGFFDPPFIDSLTGPGNFITEDIRWAVSGIFGPGGDGISPLSSTELGFLLELLSCCDSDTRPTPLYIQIVLSARVGMP